VFFCDDEPGSKRSDGHLSFVDRSFGLPSIFEDTDNTFDTKSNRTGFFAVLVGCSWSTISSMRDLCSR